MAASVPKVVIRQMVAMCDPRRTRWFVLISRFMRCQLCLSPVRRAPIKPWHVCNSASAPAKRWRFFYQYSDKDCCDAFARKPFTAAWKTMAGLSQCQNPDQLACLLKEK